MNKPSILSFGSGGDNVTFHIARCASCGRPIAHILFAYTGDGAHDSWVQVDGSCPFEVDDGGHITAALHRCLTALA